MIRMASVEQALQAIEDAGAARLMPAETVPFSAAEGRRLAAPATAMVFQPSACVSSMDGYAARFSDLKEGASLKLIGESRAGSPFAGALNPGQVVRIFTGAYLPEGADHVLIQENAERAGDTVKVAAQVGPMPWIRRKGQDFSAGDVLVPAGFSMTTGALALAAAGNVAELSVRRRPRIGILANGDELAAPGSMLAPGQVVNSIAPALMTLVRRWGGAAVDLGVAKDDEADVRRRIAVEVDVVLSIGGASVGDYDVVRTAFAKDGYEPIFEKVAVKPGKPTWFSAKAARLALGLPGNPAAAMVTAQLFLKPLIGALTAAEKPPAALMMAQTETRLPETQERQEYLRAVLTIGRDGRASGRAAEDQDSSLLHPFLLANALIRRPAHSPAAEVGASVEMVWLD